MGEGLSASCPPATTGIGRAYACGMQIGGRNATFFKKILGGGRRLCPEVRRSFSESGRPQGGSPCSWGDVGDSWEWRRRSWIGGTPLAANGGMPRTPRVTSHHMAERDDVTNSVSALMSGILNATDVDYLGMNNAQFSAFVHVLAFYIGGKREVVDGFVVARPDTEAGTLTVYWIAGNALGSLTVARSDPGSSAAPQIEGWLRPVWKVQKLDLGAEVKIDRGTKEMDVRPTVSIHFRDEPPVEISAAGLANERARKQATDFVARLKALIAGVA